MDESVASLQLGEVADMCAASICLSGRPGHSVLPIQQAVAAASPSAWQDALVVGVGRDGHLELVTVIDGEQVSLWHHTNLDVGAGEPVAWHAVAGVLAAGGQLHSVHAH